MFEDVYTDLRHMAAGYLAHERAGHTLQPTALVHEAYVRLQGADSAPVDRPTLLAAAARAMRRALVDHARRRNAGKRRQEGARRLNDRRRRVSRPRRRHELIGTENQDTQPGRCTCRLTP